MGTVEEHGYMGIEGIGEGQLRRLTMGSRTWKRKRTEGSWETGRRERTRNHRSLNKSVSRLGEGENGKAERIGPD